MRKPEAFMVRIMINYGKGMYNCKTSTVIVVFENSKTREYYIQNIYSMDHAA